MCRVSSVVGGFGHSDSFYGVPAFPNGIDYADYNTWNVGVGFTYKVFTLDLRYSDADLFARQLQRLHQRQHRPLQQQLQPDQPDRCRLDLVRRDSASPSSPHLTAVTNLK